MAVKRIRSPVLMLDEKGTTFFATCDWDKPLIDDMKKALRAEADRIMAEAKARGAHLPLLYDLTEHLVHPGK